MFLSHLKVAIRNLLRNKIYAFINVVGLSVGIASIILIGVYVQFETSYDKFFKDSDRIYRVALHRVYPTRTKDFGTSGIQVATRLKQNYPQVEQATRLHRLYFQNEIPVTIRDTVNDTEKNFIETRFLFADSLFFEVFSYQFIHGDRQSALDNMESVVITRSTALRYFGETDVVDRTFEAGGTLRIAGVIEDIPDNSHIHFDLLGSMASLGFLRNAIETDNWSSPWVYTYIKLREGVDPGELEAQLEGMVDRFGNASLSSDIGAGWKDNGHAFEYFLQPVTSIHLQSQTDVEVEPNSNVSYIYILSVIAIFILIISSINFINLSIARSSERAKEIGIRKVLGSYKGHLIWQFLVESIVLALLSGGISSLILWYFVPRFNRLLGTHLKPSEFLDPVHVTFILFSILTIGVLSGLYPAFSISSLKPVKVLKGSFRTGEKGIWLRNVLITFQFWVSIIMISGTIVAFRQMQFLQTKDLGFDKENVLVVKQAFNLDENFQAFKNEVLSLPGVKSIGNVSVLPGQFHGSNVFSVNDPNIPDIRVNTASADDNYIGTMGLEIVEGRSFDPAFNDSLSVIVNEAMVEAMGIPSALGYKIQGGVSQNQQSARTIVGVVKNFNFYSLHSKVSPYVIFNTGPTAISNIAVIRFQSTKVDDLIHEVSAIWDQFTQEEFNYSFLDHDLLQQYQSDQNTTTLFNIFTYIAIIMSCIGLFGLATYLVNQRGKEMSIRKVLGASIFHIIGVFSKQFMILIAISFMLGIPMAYLTLRKWLEDFAYHVDIGIISFVTAGVITLLLVLLTVSYQALKIARVDPVKMLRSE